MSRSFFDKKWYLLGTAILGFIVLLGDFYNVGSSILAWFNPPPTEAITAACKQPDVFHDATLSWVAAGRDVKYETPEGHTVQHEARQIAKLASLTGDAKLEQIGRGLFQHFAKYVTLRELGDTQLLRRNTREVFDLQIAFANRCDELGVAKRVKPKSITKAGNVETCNALGSFTEAILRSLATTSRYESKLASLSSSQLSSVAIRAGDEKLYLAALAVVFGYVGLNEEGNTVIEGLGYKDYLDVVLYAWKECDRLGISPQFDLKAFLEYRQKSQP